MKLRRVACDKNARMTNFAVHNEWRKSRPPCTEFRWSTLRLPPCTEFTEYSPNEEREEEVQWALTSNGKFTFRYVWVN